MTVHRHALSVLVLFVEGAFLAPVVAHASEGHANHMRWHDIMATGSYYRVRFVDNDPNDAIASAELRVSSDAGNEDLDLTESDTWLHGSAALSALPAKDAALTLTLHDEGSASLMTFSGTLTTDGAVTLEAKSAETYCDKLGCTSIEPGDVEVLSAEVYPSGKGYALTLDLAGADTYEVAYATLEVSGGEKAEVDWDAVGSVWTAESTLEHSGVIDVRAKVLDAEGSTIDNVKAELAESWLDDGEGVNALSAGAGTSVALHRWDGEYDGGKEPGTWSGSRQILTVVSNGWTTSEYPTHAEMELAGGDTVTVPANSYQRTNISGGSLLIAGTSSWLLDDSSLSISSGNIEFNVDLGDLDLASLDAGHARSAMCSSGTCVALVENEQGYEASFTVYGQDPAKLPAKQDFDVVFYDKEGTKVGSERISVAFDAEVTAVFASDLEIDGDPIGGDASGSVSLLGAADQKGRQATLSKGAFYGSFSRDSDGDLGVGGYGTDEWATSETSASVLLGDPVECGGAGCGDDWRPPVIAYAGGGHVWNSTWMSRPDL
ncbi:MAG: hypothetical protein Q8P41_13060 [Pseudomonadota bacterium]|nr:hypothetical protein [Pseudomonadota bacterium]